LEIHIDNYQQLCELEQSLNGSYTLGDGQIQPKPSALFVRKNEWIHTTLGEINLA